MNVRVKYRPYLAPGIASDFIRSPECIRPGSKVFLWCRVSSPANAGHLQAQEQHLRSFAEERRAIVVGVDNAIIPGYDDPFRDPPRGCNSSSWSSAIAQAAKKAHDFGAVLLAESTDRFVRPADYSPSIWPQAQASTLDLEELRLLTGGITLVTMAAPDADPRTIRSKQTRRGQSKSRATKGGRKPAKRPGYVTRRKAAKLQIVLELRRAGASMRDIRRETDLPLETVRRWLSKHG